MAEDLSKDEVIAALRARGAAADRAAQYADVFMTYREAQRNIDQNGAVVAHPRTGAPLENPYLKIRDRALTQLRRLRGVAAAFLWG
jgi:phage terminase small subunit